jgi:protocatechuate 3,4-dioxygenase, beta subunit
MNPNRRAINRSLIALPATGLYGQTLFAQAKSGGMLKPTPQETEGPFYPMQWRGDIDGDLVTLNGKTYAKGTLLTLMGQVLDTNGKSIPGATVEIWQADETGKYRHPNDGGEGPAERGFQGFGRTQSLADGSYRFRTIKPVRYSSRPPHVHMRVIAPRFATLTTQMYFAGENKEGNGFADVFGGFSRERERLTVNPASDKTSGRETLIANFDLILAAG